MRGPVLITHEKRKPFESEPVLIVDKKGIVGGALYEKIKRDLLVVLVSSEEPLSSTNLIFLPYKKKIPQIPGDKFFLIIFIDNGEKDIFFPFIKKAKEDKIKFVFITNRRTIDEPRVAKITSLYEEASVIVLGDLFGVTLVNAQTPTTIDRYLYEAVLKKSIHIEGTGLVNLYPVLFDDAIHEILQTIFGIQKQEKITCIFQKHPVTELSIAHSLQKVEPFLRIDFIETKKKNTDRKEKEVFYDGVYPLKTDIAQERIISLYKKLLLLHKAQNTAGVQVTDQVSQTKTFNTKPRLFTGFFSILFICFLLAILPFFSFITFSFMGKKTFDMGKSAFERGDTKKAHIYGVVSKKSFSLSYYTANVFLLEMNVLKLSGTMKEVIEKIQTGKTAADGLVQITDATLQFENIVKGETNDPKSTFAAGVRAIRQAIVDIKKIQTEDPVLYNTKFSSYAKDIQLVESMIDIMPKLLGFEGKRVYAVLFQDNTELRPGGGVIGSYGLLTLEKGKVADFTIHNVYDADGQLRAHVEPPFAIRRYMPLVHWFLHDSNFDVDFVKDASSASYFLKLETGQSVDGVVGVDLSFVQELLTVLGPVTVAEYNETVSKDTFFLLAEKHAEKNFPVFQKKDFLTALFIAIKEKLQGKNSFSYPSFLNILTEGLQRKDVVMAVATSSLQNVFTVNNISSSLWDKRPLINGVINDAMGISEANMGANKVNHFIKRSVKQTVSLDNVGKLREIVDITYNNTSKNEWPGGSYKNYLRVVLPQQTRLTDIAINGQSQKIVAAVTDPFIYEEKGFVPPSGIEVETTQEEEKAIYGFLVIIPASSIMTVSISYELTMEVDLANPQIDYNLLIYKQPGTKDDLFEFSFAPPNQYAPIEQTRGVITEGEKLVKKTYLSTDQNISIRLAKR